MKLSPGVRKPRSRKLLASDGKIARHQSVAPTSIPLLCSVETVEPCRRKITGGRKEGEHMMPDRFLGPRYLLSLGELVMSDRHLGLLIAGGTIISAHDNFMVSSDDDDAKIYREWVTGSVEVFFSSLHVAVKSYELIPKERLPVWLLTLPIRFPHSLRIYRDTAFVVFISYMLLLDMDLSYFWLAAFPAIPIVGMSAHCIKLYLAGELGTHNGKMMTTTKGSDMALTVMASVPFMALLGMAQLDDERADRFVISPFLLFLSTTLGALTHMMTRLPSRAGSPGPGAWELLHKTFLLLLLVTLHTVAAEALGEDLVLVCMPELVPVVTWFSLHLDRDSSIISLDNMRRTFKDAPIVRGAVVIAGPLLVYLWTYMDRSWISTCSAILVSCGISGLLTSYLVLMLHQWPMQQAAAAADISLQSKKPSEEAVRSGEQAAGSSEAVQLLELWAILLLTVAVASLLLKCAIAYRLGLQEPLVDTCALPTFSKDVLGNLFGKWGQTN